MVESILQNVAAALSSRLMRRTQPTPGHTQWAFLNPSSTAAASELRSPQNARVSLHIFYSTIIECIDGYESFRSTDQQTVPLHQSQNCGRRILARCGYPAVLQFDGTIDNIASQSSHRPGIAKKFVHQPPRREKMACRAVYACVSCANGAIAPANAGRVCLQTDQRGHARSKSVDCHAIFPHLIWEE